MARSAVTRSSCRQDRGELRAGWSHRRPHARPRVVGRIQRLPGSERRRVPQTSVLCLPGRHGPAWTGTPHTRSQAPTVALACHARRSVSPQLTAFFASAPILASPAAVNSFSAKAAGHMAPSSRFALSLKPNVAYLVLNFCALWKQQTTLPSLAYAVIPYP